MLQGVVCVQRWRACITGRQSFTTADFTPRSLEPSPVPGLTHGNWKPDSSGYTRDMTNQLLRPPRYPQPRYISSKGHTQAEGTKSTHRSRALLGMQPRALKAGCKDPAIHAGRRNQRRPLRNPNPPMSQTSGRIIPINYLTFTSLPPSDLPATAIQLFNTNLVFACSTWS